MMGYPCKILLADSGDLKSHGLLTTILALKGFEDTRSKTHAGSLLMPQKLNSCACFTITATAGCTDTLGALPCSSPDDLITGIYLVGISFAASDMSFV